MQDAFSAIAFGPIPAPAIAGEHRAVISRDLVALETSWTELEARSGASIFQSYTWCRAWIEASQRAGCREKPYVVTVWNGDRLVLLWPLMVRRLGPFRVLQSLGDPATQYSDALVAQCGHRERWIEAAWQELRSLRGIDAVLLKGVRADAAIAPILASQGERFVTRRAESPFADFRPNAHGGPIRRRSGRTRNALQRHLRNLGEHGNVAFELVADPQARVAAMREALRLKTAWLRRTKQISAGYAHPANADFLQGLAVSPDFLVARISIDGRTAAVEAGFLRNGCYASLVQTYDEQFAAHGPGRLLFWHMVEHAAAIGIEVLDFLAPAYPHKREWSNDAMPVRDYIIPMRIGGWAAAFYIRRIRPQLKQGLERLRRIALAKPSRRSGDATPVGTVLNPDL